MAQVLTRSLADIDVLEIWNYIAEDSFEAADNWIGELNKRMLLWASQPNMGREKSDLAHGLRSFPFGRYLVIYIPINDPRKYCSLNCFETVELPLSPLV